MDGQGVLVVDCDIAQTAAHRILNFGFVRFLDLLFLVSLMDCSYVSLQKSLSEEERLALVALVVLFPLGEKLFVLLRHRLFSPSSLLSELVAAGLVDHQFFFVLKSLLTT